MTVERSIVDGTVKVTLRVTPRQLVAIKELNDACMPARAERPPRWTFDVEQWRLGIRRILDTRAAVELLEGEPYNAIEIVAER